MSYIASRHLLGGGKLEAGIGSSVRKMTGRFSWMIREDTTFQQTQYLRHLPPARRSLSDRFSSNPSVICPLHYSALRPKILIENGVRPAPVQQRIRGEILPNRTGKIPPGRYRDIFVRWPGCKKCESRFRWSSCY